MTLNPADGFFRLLFQNNPKPMWVVDLQSLNLLEVNRAAEIKYGYSRNEFLDKNVFDLLAPESAEQPYLNLKDSPRDKANFSSIHCKKDGSSMEVEIQIEIIEQDGQMLGYMSAQDVFMSERANPPEETLKRNQERLEEAEKQANLGSWEFNVESGQGWWSKQMYLMIGVPQSDRVPDWESYLEFIHPEDRGFTLEVLENMSLGAEPTPQEFRSNPQRGPLRYFLPTVQVVKNEDGKPVRFTGTLQDITRHKKIEQELLARKEELWTLYKLSTQIRKSHSTESMMSLVLDEILRIFRADSGWIALLSSSGNQFKIALAKGSWQKASGHTFSTEKGLSGISIRSSKTVVTENYAAEQNALPLKESARTGPAVFVPLRSEVEQIGVLAVARDQKPDMRTFEKNEVHLLESIGEMTGAALRRQGLYEEATKRLRQMRALHRIDKSITGSLDLQGTLDTILREVISQLRVDAALILIYDSSSETLKYAAGRGFRGPGMQQAELRLDDSYAGQALMEPGVVLISKKEGSSNKSPVRARLMAEEGFHEHIAVPLVTKGNLLGVLEVFKRESLDDNQEWVDYLIALAEQTAIAIDNATLFNGLQAANTALLEAYDATIEGWSLALDLRDRDTEEHTRRVTELTVRLAQKMGVDEEEMLNIRRGALLHDIGKLAVPDGILRKPAPLNVEEWSLMRQHPVFSKELISSIEYLRPALDIPYYHHEKWDGTGYPEGLKGESIPLAARMFAVVDVWDALSSDRPYRPAWQKEKALNYIFDQKGKQFDPEVVKAFIELLEEGEV